MHSNQNRAAHAPDLQGRDDDDAEERERRLRSAHVAQGDKGRRVRHDDARVVQSDDGDEKADASSHCRVQLVRDAAQDQLTDAASGEQQEGHAGDKDGSQGGLPGYVHLEYDRVGEVGIQSHAGCERDGITRDDAHENRPERGRNAGGRGDGGQRDSRLGQDGGVHHDDVSHGDEGRESGEKLRTPVGIQTGELKIAFEGSAHGPSKHRSGKFPNEVVRQGRV